MEGDEKMSDVIISKREIGSYHEMFCPYSNAIYKSNRIYISEEDAIKRGYRECKFCHSVRGIVYKYKALNNLEISYDKIDDALCVRTQIGFWKLCWRDQQQAWYLFHMNHKGWKSFNDKYPSKFLMRGSFHRQDDFPPTTSISKAISYIDSHDKNYKIAEENVQKMSKTNSKQRKWYRIQKERKKREKIKNVFSIFKEIERAKK